MINGVQYLAEKEEQFGWILDDYGIPPDVSRAPGYESLVLIILEQQVSLDSAKATFNRLRNATRVTAQDINRRAIEEIRNCGITRQKASYIKGLAHQIVTGEIDMKALDSAPVEMAFDTLLSIKGIGPWTAQIYLMFCLGAPDIFPKGDIALDHALKELFDLSPEEGQEYAKQWSPYRSHAAYLLWHYYLCKRNRKVPE